MNSVAIAPVYIHSSVKRRKQTWYTIANGNWSDPNIWSSNSRRRYSYPSASIGSAAQVTSSAFNVGTFAVPTVYDDVFINHSVTLDVGSTSTSGIAINNLYISGTLSMNSALSRSIQIVGDLQVSGTLDVSAGTPSIYLYGVNNYVNTFVAGTGSTINYVRTGDQSIVDLSYRHLGIYGTATKSLTNNLTVAGNLAAQGASSTITTKLECSTYNLTVTGTSILGPLTLSKTGSGSLLFVGAVTYSSLTATNGLSLTGNPTVEFRGGTSFSSSGTPLWDTGTNTWSATTATQTWTFSTGTFPYTAPVSIVGAITLNEAGTGIMQLNQPIDCTSASGALVCKGIIYWNSTASLPSITTGTIDRLTFANTIGYTMGASITLPYTTYWSLLTDNTGTKTALGNTSLLGNLTVGVTTASAQTGFFELSTFDLTIAGTTGLVHTLSKTGAGSVLFTGLISYSNGTGRIDFATGNPTVECRGGISGINTADTASYWSTGASSNIGALGAVGYVTGASHFKSGTGTWTFSTNNQSIASVGNQGSRFVFNCPVVISGAIILTITNFTYTAAGSQNAESLSSGFVFNGTVNGTVSGSTLRPAGFVGFNNSTTPMLTGVFDTTTSANTVGYLYDGSYTLPLTTYSGLYVGGVGTKTLAGNTTLSGNLTIGGVKPSGVFTDYGILECAAFNLTIGGTTTLGDVIGWYYSLSKSGAGSVLFTGALSTGNNSTVPNVINFSGNPTVELRGGIVMVNLSTGGAVGVVSGTGIWSFTTNSQSIAMSPAGGASTPTFDCPFLISGAITVTTSGTSTANRLILKGTLDGNNAASTFDSRASGTVEYQNAQRPMLTGVLQTNAAANTFKYNRSGIQDVRGNTYRVIEFGGTSAKTLQGNVIINVTGGGSQSTTGTASVVLNGFTITNI